MKKMVALLLAMTLVLGTLAGCSSSDSSDEDFVELTIGVGSQYTTMDPGLNTETGNAYVMDHVWSGLFYKDDDGVIQPDLAESYEVSEDGLTYTITLKEGLKWSDGEDLTADDFVWGLKRNLVYGVDNAWATNYVVKYIVGAEEYANDDSYEVEDLDDFTGIEALDDTTLVYHLTRPCAFFTTLLTSGVWYPLREDYVNVHDSEWAWEVGYPSTGAYILTEVNENEKAVVEKNENFYDAENVTVDKMTFMVMSDKDAQEAAFKTGELDVAFSVNATIPETWDDPDTLWILPSVAVYFVAINSGETGPEALKDVRVRQALAYAIDKEAMSENLGVLYPSMDEYVPGGMQGAEKDYREEGEEEYEWITYDPDKAVELLEEAGYNEDNPLQLKYKYSNSTTHADIAQMLQEQWSKVGIEIELEVVESGVFYDQCDSGDFELARYGYTSTTDPSTYLELWTTGMQVVAAVDDPEFDQMMDDVSYIVDTAEYMNALHEIEHYFAYDQCYVIPLFDYTSAALIRADIDNVRCEPGGTPIFSYATVGDTED